MSKEVWNETELTNQIDNYFDNTSKEQFTKDIEEAGCSHMVEDASLDKRFEKCEWCNGSGNDGGGYNACPDCESTGMKGGRSALEDFDNEVEKLYQESMLKTTKNNL